MGLRTWICLECDGVLVLDLDGDGYTADEEGFHADDDCDDGELAQLRARMTAQETRTDAGKAAFRELLTEYQRLEGNGPSPGCAEELDANSDGWAGHIRRAMTAATPTDDSAAAAQVGF